MRHFSKRHSELENCFSCKHTCDVAPLLRRLELGSLGVEVASHSHRNLRLIITSSFFSLESFLIPIVWYLLKWLYIWFCFHSDSQGESLEGTFIKRSD